MIFHGPAGTGKTTLAEVIASLTGSIFSKINASSAGVKEMRSAAEKSMTDVRKVIIFVDEVHRLSKNQQDVLLPYVEDGTLVLIGATTENPFHALSNALISRVILFEFEPISNKDLMHLLLRGVKYYRNEKYKVSVTDEAAKHIVTVSCGDARKLLTVLEYAVETSPDKEVKIDLELITQIAPSKFIPFSRKGEEHFDLASAYQGSIQASDPDAAVYWLAKWLESGEDPRYIARRLMVSASEDASGNPECIAAAHAAYTAACEIGRPECDIIMSHATVLIATSPRDKSAANAIWKAIKDVKEGAEVWVPKEMKDCHYPGAQKLDRGHYHDGKNQNMYVGVKKKYYSK